jgi:hypothetical protein
MNLKLNIIISIELGCPVHQVKINCKRIEKGRDCVLKRGSNYTLDMDFTPDFDAEDDLTVTASALFINEFVDFREMDINACHWMTCPVVKNVRQTYSFKLSMVKSYPKGSFDVRWWMKHKENSKCCFMNRFRIE